MLGGTNNGTSSEGSSQHWRLCGERMPRAEISFFCQIFLLFIVIIAAIVNLSLNLNPDHKELWISLLSSSIGYILPGPSIQWRKSPPPQPQQPPQDHHKNGSQ